MRLFFFLLFLLGSLQGEVLFQEPTSHEIKIIQNSFYEFAADQSVQAGKFGNKENAKDYAIKELDELVENNENHLYYAYISSVDGEIQYGYLIVYFYEEFRAAVLYGLYIEEEYRGCGIGTETLQYLEASLKERGVKDICLNVYDFNKMAFGLYKKMGYEIFYTYYNDDGVPQGCNMIKFLK
ncbi:MAG: GNAT family N-acetyltransferase [Candidatus Protochlamydia sp.]|nr:GNAT family N-acetyltransferase [Candidatus Protochlamydia sp.]